MRSFIGFTAQVAPIKTFVQVFRRDLEHTIRAVTVITMLGMLVVNGTSCSNQPASNQSMDTQNHDEQVADAAASSASHRTAQGVEPQHSAEPTAYGALSPTPAGSGTDGKQDSASSMQPQQFDWHSIETGVAVRDPNQFSYAFALDSAPVLAYANFYGITPRQAQHSLTVATASNEALGAVLDVLGKHYVSHEVTSGADVRLIIHTDQGLVKSSGQYVFTDPFARGLSIPIDLVPDGKRGANNHDGAPATDAH